MADNFKLITPHAAVLVWNYTDRLNADGPLGLNAHEVEPVIIGTSDVISISTSKSKSAPAGSFEIRLAPRYNWVSRITPGSWCAILMSTEPFETFGAANRRSFKMLGRIDSVRGVVTVDQETGARNTAFVMTGQDWGSAFETAIYIDQAVIQDLQQNQAVHQAYSILNFNMYSGFNEDRPLPTAWMCVDSVLNLWGVGPGQGLRNGQELLKSELQLTPILATDPQFKLPEAVAKYMQQTEYFNGVPILGSTAVGFAEILDRQSGRLEKYDDPDAFFPVQYTSLDESFGIPNPSAMMGQHSVWQLLTELSNPTLYELVADIRWNLGKPRFALYHRIRPFITRSEYFIEKFKFPEVLNNPLRAATTVSKIENLFKNVRRISIELNDVKDINFGTNWRDKINFVEMRPDPSLVPTDSGTYAKLAGQTIDQPGYERDGFRPRFAVSSFLPYDAVGVRLDEFGDWKYLLREWYFNTHMMLNGSVTVIGQSEYIQVGDNIQIDRAILGQGLFNVGEQLTGINKTYLTAHVEHISHNFAVNQETGARTFTTTIQFVRGIITTEDGTTVALLVPSPETGVLERSVSPPGGLVTNTKLNPNTLGFPTSSDPSTNKE